MCLNTDTNAVILFQTDQTDRFTQLTDWGQGFEPYILMEASLTSKSQVGNKMNLVLVKTIFSERAERLSLALCACCG